MPIRIRIDPLDVFKAEQLKKKVDDYTERTGLIRAGRNVFVDEKIVYRNEFELDVEVLDVEQIAARVRALRESLKQTQIQLRAAEVALKEVTRVGRK